MEHRTDLKELLEYIDPSRCSYQEWVSIGMALKHEGYAPEDWEAWSLRDARRYHAGECLRKWESFKELGTGVVTGGRSSRWPLRAGLSRPEMKSLTGQ